MEPIKAWAVFAPNGSCVDVDLAEETARGSHEYYTRGCRLDGYTCRPIQISDPETDVVVSKETYEQFKAAYILREIRAGRCTFTDLDGREIKDDGSD